MQQLYTLKILLVDDNKELLQMIYNILIQAGFQNAVSYTHLDVYKRQAPNTAAETKTIPTAAGCTANANKARTAVISNIHRQNCRTSLFRSMAVSQPIPQSPHSQNDLRLCRIGFNFFP